jgi:hypothetical protein
MLDHPSTENEPCLRNSCRTLSPHFLSSAGFLFRQTKGKTASRSKKSRAFILYINIITLHGLFRKVCFIFSAKFDMGLSSAMFPRCFFLLLLLLLLLLLTYCSPGAEVVTVDVHAAKDLIKSGHKYLDVRYAKGCSLFHV